MSKADRLKKAANNKALSRSLGHKPFEREGKKLSPRAMAFQKAFKKREEKEERMRRAKLRP